MKTIQFTIIVFSFFFFSCGDDGNEGRAFLKFDWSVTVTSYDDSNPSIPSIIWRNQSYETDKGTYYFTYSADNGTELRVWSGSYTITKNPGGKGGFLVDGKDGADKHFKLYLGWSGPSLSSYKVNLIQNKEEEGHFQKLINNKNPIVNINQSTDLKTETIQDGNFTIKLKFFIINR